MSRPIQTIEGVELAPRPQVLTGDCVTLMREMPSASVDFILTDPPYLCDYRPRDGRRVANDNQASWLEPAFSEMYRLLAPNSYCVSFYGWVNAHLFHAAWRSAGFRPLGHIVFCKQYASRSGHLRGQHESAFLLGKGYPAKPAEPVADVISFPYTGNKLHPTEKPVAALLPLIKSLCPSGGLVFDPFCGSGSSLEAARQLGHSAVGMELDPAHADTARRRLSGSW